MRFHPISRLINTVRNQWTSRSRTFDLRLDGDRRIHCEVAIKTEVIFQSVNESVKLEVIENKEIITESLAR